MVMAAASRWPDTSGDWGRLRWHYGEAGNATGGAGGAISLSVGDGNTGAGSGGGDRDGWQDHR